MGAGCSGLSLLMRILRSPSLSSKSILLIDKAPKSGNDKTWCFWDKGNIASFWNEANIVFHEWSDLYVKHPGGDLLLDINSYRYKMIRSEDFYRYCFSIIKAAPNVKVHYGSVSEIDSEKGWVVCGESSFEGSIIFSSVLLSEPVLKPGGHYLLQHFKGWWLETDKDVFNSAAADLMNFKTSQQNGCTFLYVLPVSNRKTLVEYTLFSEEELEEEAYKNGLRLFIENELGIKNYRVTGEENGVIPMTDIEFPARQGKVFFIGTASGQTKASTGYTFAFIQKQAALIIASLERKGVPGTARQARRFNFYDRVLLSILKEKRMAGSAVFYSLFKKNRAVKIFKFLDNETNLAEELVIMNSTKKRVFIPAAIRALL